MQSFESNVNSKGEEQTFSPSNPSISDALVDTWSRPIRYLRLSVTDRCNLRCSYCMPEEGWAQVHRNELMSLEELRTFVAIMAGLGVEKVRFTGGEPLLRKGIVDLVRWTAQTPGIKHVAMTTNGYGLHSLAAELREAGLNSLNVSLDTFDSARFEDVTRGGSLQRVLTGLDTARRSGFDDIRINAVAIRGVNDGEYASFVRRCWDSGWLPRFIELMPIGDLAGQSGTQRVTADEIRSILANSFELQPAASASMTAGPARYFEVQSGPYAGRRVGTISPMSDTGFCGDCNRVRLTARGGFRSCLANDDEVSILKTMREGGDHSAVIDIIQTAVAAKLESHRMTSGTFVPLSVMTGIGG